MIRDIQCPYCLALWPLQVSLTKTNGQAAFQCYICSRPFEAVPYSKDELMARLDRSIEKLERLSEQVSNPQTEGERNFARWGLPWLSGLFDNGLSLASNVRNLDTDIPLDDEIDDEPPPYGDLP